LVVVPEKVPEQLMLIPLKLIQPTFSPQAEPDKTPEEFMETPLFVGFMFIHP